MSLNPRALPHKKTPTETFASVVGRLESASELVRDVLVLIEESDSLEFSDQTEDEFADDLVSVFRKLEAAAQQVYFTVRDSD